MNIKIPNILDRRKSLYVLRRGKSIKISIGKWWINRNTPCGDDADIYQRTAHGGNKWIDPKTILGQDTDETPVETKGFWNL